MATPAPTTNNCSSCFTEPFFMVCSFTSATSFIFVNTPGVTYFPSRSYYTAHITALPWVLLSFRISVYKFYLHSQHFIILIDVSEIPNDIQHTVSDNHSRGWCDMNCPRPIQLTLAVSLTCFHGAIQYSVALRSKIAECNVMLNTTCIGL